MVRGDTPSWPRSCRYASTSSTVIDGAGTSPSFAMSRAFADASTAAPRRAGPGEDAAEVPHRGWLQAPHVLGVVQPGLRQGAECQPSALARGFELRLAAVGVLASGDHLRHQRVRAALIEPPVLDASSPRRWSAGFVELEPRRPQPALHLPPVGRRAPLGGVEEACGSA